MKKYHFIQKIETRTGTSLVTLPGQTLGRKPVSPRILVLDAKGQTVLKRTKQHAAAGDIFFTTTLKRMRNNYVAKDIYPLKGNIPVEYSDVLDAYEKQKENENNLS